MPRLNYVTVRMGHKHMQYVSLYLTLSFNSEQSSK